jgi:ubiquinol-cytochrome c reductase iron-sulfur subunit
MADKGVDKSRRRFLVGATTVVGGAGAVAAGAMFVSYWKPSARAQAAGAPVEADISKVDPGQRISVEWRGKPVWIVNRTPEMLELLPQNDPKLRDPASEIEQQPPYAKNPTRSIKPEYAVLVGICTHLGCSPTYRPDIGAADLGGPDWKGGFYCPCHGSRFDLAGRVFQNVPAPTNLVVPPHRYLSDTRILIGEDAGGAA